MTELTHILDYYVQIQKCLIANSIQEAYKKIKPTAKELRKLALWEKEGKIKAIEGEDITPLGFLNIEVIDDSIGPEIRQMQLVTFYEIEIDGNITPGLYPELEPDYEPAKRKQKSNQKGGK